MDGSVRHVRNELRVRSEQIIEYFGEVIGGYLQDLEDPHLRRKFGHVSPFRAFIITHYFCNYQLF